MSLLLITFYDLNAGKKKKRCGAAYSVVGSASRGVKQCGDAVAWEEGSGQAGGVAGGGPAVEGLAEVAVGDEVGAGRCDGRAR